MVKRRPGSSEKIEGILDATETLLLEHGYAGMTLDMVSARTKRAIGSLKHYVGDKPDLARAVHRRSSDAFEAVVAEAVKGRAHQSREDQVRRVIEATLVWTATNAARFRLIEALETHPLEHDAVERRYGDRLASVLANDPDLNADGRAGQGHPVRLFALILGPVLALARLIPLSMDHDIHWREDTVGELVAAANAGLAAGQSRSNAKAPGRRLPKRAEPGGDLFEGN